MGRVLSFIDLDATPFEIAMAFEQGPLVSTTGVEAAAIETTLDSADEEALEAGIVSVFADLRAEATVVVADNDDDIDGGNYYDGFDDEDDTVGIEPTFVLLAELNRIWAQPHAA
jgi:hypothetical protein